MNSCRWGPLAWPVMGADWGQSAVGEGLREVGWLPRLGSWPASGGWLWECTDWLSRHLGFYIYRYKTQHADIRQIRL